MGNPYCENDRLINPSETEAERAVLLERLKILRARLNSVSEFERGTQAEIDALEEKLFAGQRSE